MTAIEFYNTPDGTVMYKHVGGSVRELHEGDRELVMELFATIRDRYPRAFKALSDLYSKQEESRETFEFKIVSRFVRCNFGEFDMHTTDIDADGMFRFEEVKCPLRGECIYEGIICKPSLNTKLSDREIEVLALIAKGYESDDIAQELCISRFTVCRHRDNIKAKLKLRKTAQLVTWYNTNIEKK
jgi:DNA-binding CsgD family transcriptional regulator